MSFGVGELSVMWGCLINFDFKKIFCLRIVVNWIIKEVFGFIVDVFKVGFKIV